MPILTDQEFIIDIGPQGTFRNSGNYQTVPADVDAIFAKFEAEGIQKIALYFHGGLVSETSGLKGARDIRQHIENGGCYPVCFVWETGLLETIGTNLAKISETKLFNKLLKLLLKKVTEKLGYDTPLGRGVPRGGLTDAQINLELSKPVPFADYTKTAPPENSRTAINTEALAARRFMLQTELSAELSGTITVDPDFQALIRDTRLTVANDDGGGSRGIISSVNFISHVVKVAYRIITRFLDHRDHDLYPTIVEEILREFYVAELGAWVWKMMKDKSDGMWTDNTDRSGPDQYAGRYFLDKLAAYKATHPEVTVDLIGHSAGSIAICNLFKHTAAHTQPFAYNHVIFMAPAVRIDLFKTEMLAFPGRYRDIRIFTMNDYYECRDIMVPFFYTHSLLYLISGALEDEGISYDAYILGLERHIGYLVPYAIPDLQGTHDYLYMAALNRVSFSVFGGTDQGLETQARKHGEFHGDAATLRSMTFILNK
ncbi:hypothetical protein ACFFGT_10490 [Mucilaginibacter angelicae]|uniref:Alpha/beta hydrolase n=1 Tax=Mucilaginibacter angelicae TaxID=869718 RepID=A0ABV6L5B4_9SPHI